VDGWSFFPKLSRNAFRGSRRTIDLPGVTRTALSAHQSKQATERIFTPTMGTPLDGRNLTKRFQRILKNTKIPGHRFHDLRHKAATLLAIQDPVAVKQPNSKLS
jgi:integrase